MITNATPVLIIGDDLTGLALAVDLAHRGIRSTILAGASSKQPVDVLGTRTMEMFRRWGLADEVRMAGQNRHYTQSCAWVTSLHGLEFGREPIPSPALADVDTQSPAVPERLPHRLSASVLRRAVDRSDLIDVVIPESLVGIDHRDNYVDVVVQDADTRARTIRATFVVVSNGDDRVVRSSLDIGLTTVYDGGSTRELIFLDDGLDQAHTTRPARRYDFIGRKGHWATLESLNGRDEWRFTLLCNGEGADVPNDLLASLAFALGTERAVKIVSTGERHDQYAIAETFSRGRVFLAGDAAHQTPAAGGLERNGGIFDAVNLSWKLAAVLDGWGGAQLLQSYDIEQRPLAELDVREAVANRRRMRTEALIGPPAMLFDFTDISAAAMDARRVFGHAFAEATSRLWYPELARFGVSYHDSPLTILDREPAVGLSPSKKAAPAASGLRAPHVWLDAAKTKSILDHFGSGFVLLRFETVVNVDDVQAAANEIGVPLQVVNIESRQAAELYECALVLVRPDGHVAWRGEEATDPAQLLAAVTARRPTAE